MRLSFIVTLATTALIGCTSAPNVLPVPDHAVIGVTEAQRTPGYWIKKDPRAERVTLDRAQIESQNSKLLSTDKSVPVIRKLPATLPVAEVRGWMEKLSSRPSESLHDQHGQPVPAATLDEF